MPHALSSVLDAMPLTWYLAMYGCLQTSFKLFYRPHQPNILPSGNVPTKQRRREITRGINDQMMRSPTFKLNNDSYTYIYKLLLMGSIIGIIP